MKRLAASLATSVSVLAFVAAGCGGNGGGEGSSASDPGEAMLTLFDYLKKGQYGRAWEMLLPEHQEVVTRSKFDECRSDLRSEGIPADAKFEIEEIFDETIDVVPLGEIPTKAITWRVTVDGESVDDTNHLVEREGEWKWLLTTADYEAYERGECPLE